MNMNMILLLVFMLVMFYIMSSTTRRQRKAQQDLQNALSKGDEVVTIGGLHGVVDEANDKTVTLNIEGVCLTFERRAIARIVKDQPATTAAIKTSTAAAAKKTTKSTAKKATTTAKKKSTTAAKKTTTKK